VPVAHHTPATLFIHQPGMGGQERLDLGLDRLHQHASGAFAQHRLQRVVGDAGSWPGQCDNAILLHGVSFLVT
jgi:hypothetical protein